MLNEVEYGYFSEATRRWFHDTLGEPTAVQAEAWPVIADRRHVLVSAPTGTGKTLTAFLVFIDQMKKSHDIKAKNKASLNELQLIYISPLKSLAGDIRENLFRPLNGIDTERHITVSVRTGDTTAAERRKMIKSPPHILITTPESLYLLLTSKSGRSMLKTAKAIILDELHAMIDSKRGAHLMLSLARLDQLAGQPLQRVGLSATIKPLNIAADYLSGGYPVDVVAPKMYKEIQIKITSPLKNDILPKGTIWPEIAQTVLEHCEGARTVIAFSEGRLMSEKLAYYINEIAGEGFARTHHGSVSKEQRMDAENALRAGTLRLLCATSSMELGIDVGDIDRVLQIACPSSIASVMQRLGRAGHNPGRVSVMHMFPRMVSEGLYCGMTAKVAMDGGIEALKPPRLCFDVLAQHLVSISLEGPTEIDDVMKLLAVAYPFREVTADDVRSILEMLAGDYEHKRDHPVRPRILYDRINGWFEGDAYSRMLATFSAGTIPDTGMFAAKTQAGVKIGDLDEEFVTEQRHGYKFLLGSFAWKITKIDRDTVTVAPTNPIGAKPPFWRHIWLCRKLQTGLAFGKILRRLSEVAIETCSSTLHSELHKLGLDEKSADGTAKFILRQIEATGVLPDDRTIVIEHFLNEAGSHEIMIHSIYGRQVNAPFSMLLVYAAKKLTDIDVDCFEDDDGILLMARGERALPDNLPMKLLHFLEPEAAKGLLTAMLPGTALFNIVFRHNAGRSLMMGMRNKKRTPLWLQRLRSQEMMDSVVSSQEHPLIRESKRECTEDYWDLSGLEEVLTKIQSGSIKIRELYLDSPSPMALPLRSRAEFELVYDYTPTTSGVYQSVADAVDEADKNLIKPSHEQLARINERRKLPEDENQLHSLLMIEGDVIASDLMIGNEIARNVTTGGLNVPYEWFESLAEKGRCLYIEPGLWIAKEHEDEYLSAFSADIDAVDGRFEVQKNIIRRALRYRGAMSPEHVAERYFIASDTARELLESLREQKSVIKLEESCDTAHEGSSAHENSTCLYYHADLYERARNATISEQRRSIKTVPSANYAALMVNSLRMTAPPTEQIESALKNLSGIPYPVANWESILLPARVNMYRPAMLDTFLSSGAMFWRIKGNSLTFHLYDDIDWDSSDLAISSDLATPDLDEDEHFILKTLQKRGASFIAALPQTGLNRPLHELLFSLMEKGLIHADNFTPVRVWLEREKIASKPSLHQRINARVMAMTSGRWDIIRPMKILSVEEQIARAFQKTHILCKETAAQYLDISWSDALEALRIWEFTGRAMRGYFVEGLSGAQYIEKSKYTSVTFELENQQADQDVHWIAASDPSQAWGKSLAYGTDRPFTRHIGTVVGLHKGLPVAVFEGNGRTLRIFDDEMSDKRVSVDEMSDGELIKIVLSTFVDAFNKKRIFPAHKRIILKNYPAEAAKALVYAGFSSVMLDYILRR